MNIDDVKEWIIIADDDFDSAEILNQAFRKHNEIICYHCANDIRYPYRYETKEDDVNFCINVVKKSEILNQLLIYGKVNILV